MPDLPAAPVREGSRWRYHKPSGEEVADWFKDVPLDEGMSHDKFVSGVVVIPAKEKVEKQVEKNGRIAVEDQYEMTFTPYVRVDTRINYFRQLAAKDGLIAVIEPAFVPRVEQGETANANLPDGFWWHYVPTGDKTGVRFICCTMRVALYEKDEWAKQPTTVRNEDGSASGTITLAPPRPLREGVGTKQVATSRGNSGLDPNMLAKAETGAVGRALGMAGILVIGTGIATAEDMAEVRGEQPAAVAALPEPIESETPEQLEQRLISLQAALSADFPDIWKEVEAWWKERCQAEGWTKISDAPLEVRRGMATRMERRLEEGRAATPDSSPEPEPAPHGSTK